MGGAGVTMAHMGEVIQISGYDLCVGEHEWAWASKNAAGIKRYWKRAQVEKPAMFNGEILLLADWKLNADTLRGTAVQTDFASFLYWKDKGMPEDAGVLNVFGCAAVRSSDGHLLFGRMGPQTAGSGRVYPMAGTPDLDDIRDGKLDLEGSIVRELKEEAGLDAEAAARKDGYQLVVEGGMCALVAELVFDAPSRDLKAQMMRHIDTQDEPELDEIVVFRRAAFHVHHRMPLFARTLVQHMLD